MKRTQAQLDKLDADAFCGPNKSFPIVNQADVDAAAKLVGQAAAPASVKAKIIDRAKALGLDIPEAWETEDDAADADDTEKHADVDGRPSQQDMASRLSRAVDAQLPGATMVEHGARALIAQHGYGADAKHMRHPFSRKGGVIKIGQGAPVRQAWVESESPEEEREEGETTDAQPAALSDAEAETLAFATDLRGLQMAEGKTVAIEVCRDGSWPGHPKGGKIDVTPEFREALVKNFDAKVRKVDLALDYAHDTSGPAAGWFRRVYNDGNRTLAEVDFTALATGRVKSGEYRYFSPEWHPNYRDPQSGKEHGPTLFGGGLTNRPFLRGMAAIQCAEASADAGRPTGEETTDMAEMKDTTIALDLLKQQVATQQVEIATLRAGEERRQLTDEVGGLEFADKSVLTPASRALYVEALILRDADGRKALIDALKGHQVVQLGELGHAGSAPTVGDDGMTEYETELVKSMAKDNGLKFDEVKAHFLKVKKSRGID